MRFFAAHCGLFHFVYFVFIVGGRGGLGSPFWYLLCGIAFAASHFASLRHTLEKDAAGRPDVFTLMFLPYARVVPMHLMILTGMAFSSAPNTMAFLLFGALKTAADAVMHLVEHHALENAGR
ncbi:MAG TPA: DUF6498-containing protein [Burkholderiales bacterium]